MPTISLDFSHKPDLLPLARVVGALQSVAEPKDLEFLLIGAAARGLMLRHAHNIEPSRQTEDVDLGVLVQDWDAFATFREALIRSGAFLSRPGPATHRLLHSSGLPLDVIPFGAIERPDRTIAWPPDHAVVFDCFGMREALAASVWVRLSEQVSVRVPSVPALTLLKIAAWHDRKYVHPGKDAGDLLFYLRTYMDCGNFERAATDHADLFTGKDYDHEVAGARLLARDLSRFLEMPALQRVVSILNPEADESGPLLLASQSRLDLERARRLIEAVCNELGRR